MTTKLSLFVFLAASVFGGKSDWYKNAIFYQVYPRSFKDSNNDGIGDLRGIHDKLDYLKDTGVTVAWLSPIFQSPQVDHGYDISDYYSIDSDYGNLNDLMELLSKAEKLGIKIVLDIVPNHTSDQHHWFVKSVNRVQGYQDYYVWVDAKIDEDGKYVPPNNWLSIFSNSAWTWNNNRQQYYLHLFDPAQPDLNLRNKEVVEELKRVLAFYLDLGVAGFRIDAPPYLVEDKDLRDEPLSRISNVDQNHWNYLQHVYTKDTDESFELLYEFRAFIDDYNLLNGGDDRIILTESYTDFNKTLLYYGNSDATKMGAHFTFNFELVEIYFNATASDIKEIIERWIHGLDKKYPYNWGVGNHDNHRTASRMGNVDGYNMLILFLPGIAEIYYGEEIGQENGEVNCEEGTDPKAIHNCTTFHLISRDYERTPFQWDDTVNAGFNNGAKPWLPIGRKYKRNNLKMQNVPGVRSHYNIFKDMVKIRRLLTEYNRVFIDDYYAQKNVLHIARSLSDRTRKSYILLFNMERSQNRTVHLGRNIYELLVGSKNSQYVTGQIFQRDVVLLPQESLVVKQISNIRPITYDSEGDK